MERRGESEDQAREEGRHNGERQHAGVQAQVEGVDGDKPRQREFRQGGEAELGDAESGRRPEARQEKALGEQLCGETPLSGAQRQPHGDLAPAAARSGEEEVRDVGAGHQERGAHHAHQEQDEPGHIRSGRHRQRDPLHGLDGHVAGPPLRGKLFTHVLRQCGEVSTHLFQGHARLPAADQPADPPGGANAQAVAALVLSGGDQIVRGEWNPHFGFGVQARAPERARRHADDGVRCAVQANLSSDGVGLPAEPVRPEAVTQDGDLFRPAALVVARDDESSEVRSDTQQSEVIAARQRALNNAIPVADDEGQPHVRECRHIQECPVPVAVIEIVGI